MAVVMLVKKVYWLTFTLRDYPIPHHTSWRKIAKHTEIMHIIYSIWDMQSQIWYIVLILNITRISYRLSKNIFSGSFPVKFWNFHFRFLCILPKDAELNFRGSHRGYFRDPRMLCAKKVNFWPLRRKIASS